MSVGVVFFFQAEDGIRDLVRSRGLGDVYKRQPHTRRARADMVKAGRTKPSAKMILVAATGPKGRNCLLYTSDAADERSSVDLGGRRIIKKKNRTTSARGRD